jgi:hypothetical protein
MLRTISPVKNRLGFNLKLSPVKWCISHSKKNQYIFRALDMTKPRSNAQRAQIAGLATVRKVKYSQENALPLSHPKTRCRAQEDMLNEIICQKETKIQD